MGDVMKTLLLAFFLIALNQSAYACWTKVNVINEIVVDGNNRIGIKGQVSWKNVNQCNRDSSEYVIITSGNEGFNQLLSLAMTAYSTKSNVRVCLNGCKRWRNGDYPSVGSMEISR